MRDLDELLGHIAASADGGRALMPPSQIRRLAARRRQRTVVATGTAVALVIVGVAFIARAPHHRVAGDTAANPTPGIVTTVDGGPVANYVDFVRLNGISYLSAAQFLTNEAFVGTPLGTIRRRATADEPATPQDGVAAFLPVGTEIASFQGYRQEFRVLAHTPQGWKVYEADVTGARTGRDSLDIAGRVARIDVLSYASHGTQVLRTVTDPSTVAAVVAAVEDSPAGAYDGATPTDFIAFAMTDGTRVIRWYDAPAGILGGIRVPSSVTAALATAAG